MRPARPLLYAHRGASAEFPENTLCAFRRALELGADVLEMDVHMTADGHVVVAHDPDGRRMCAVDREIRHTLLKDLKEWDAGAGFTAPDGSRPHADKGHRIPTLDEVLEAFPDVPLNVDLKQSQPDMARAFVSVVRRHGAEPRVTAASFEDGVLRRVRRLGYAGPTGLSRGEVRALLLVPRALRALRPVPGDAAQMPLEYKGYRFDTPQFIGRCHDLGLRVDFWTINDPVDAHRLLDLGADGIMTDDPAAIAPVFRERFPELGPSPLRNVRNIE